MNNEAWKRWEQDYQESLGASALSPNKPTEENKEYEPYDFLEVGKITARAYFFITEDNAFHTHGFWVPQALVSKIDYETNQVFIEEWFKRNIVDFNK